MSELVHTEGRVNKERQRRDFIHVIRRNDEENCQVEKDGRN